MGIYYITGRSGTGKTRLVYKEIGEALSRGEERLILMVPEQFTLQAESDLINSLDLPGLFNVEVVSLTRLAYKVFSEAGGLTRTHINDQGRHMVLRKILDDLVDELTVYRTVSVQKGFIDKINTALAELKKHDVTADRLKEAAWALEGSGLLKHKLLDIAKIYEAFNEYLSGRYIDSEDAINLLIEKMDQAQFLRGASVWMDGFDYFAPQTVRVIEKLAMVAKKLTITFTLDIDKSHNDRDVFLSHALSLSRIRKMALHHGFEEHFIHLTHQIPPAQKGAKAPEIAFLEHEIYKYPYRQYTDPPAGLEVFAGSSLLSEIENLASRIISLVRDRNWRFNEMAVLAGDIKVYGGIVKRVFTEYGIPYFMDEKRSIIQNPIIDCLLVSLRIIERDFRYEDVFKYLKTGFSGLSLDEVEELENYCLEFGVRGRQWLEPFERGNEDYDLDRINALRERFVKPFDAFGRAIKRKKTVEGMVKSLYEFLNSIELKEKLEDWIGDLRREGLLDQVNENAQIWNILMEIFDQLVEFLGDRRVDLGSFGRILEAGFMSLEVGIIPTTLDQVLVGDIRRSKIRDIKALFIVGCNDGLIPASNGDEGLLDVEELDKLRGCGVELGGGSELRAANEKLDIYMAFSKPSDYLWVSYSMANAEGNAIRPSILIDRLKKLFRELKVESDVVMNHDRQLRLVSVPDSTFKYLVENMRTLADGKPMDEVWWQVYGWYRGQKAWESRRRLLIDGLFHRNQEDTIGRNASRLLYSAPIRASISRLETYSSCPFAHFVRYGLRPRERRMYTVEAPDLGVVFHRTIEEFTNKLAEDKADWRTMDENRINEILDEVMDDIIPTYNNGVLQSTNRYKYLANRLKRISRRAVWLLTDHVKRSGFDPIGHEVSFGEKGKYPPIEIELENGEKLLLEGRIDRADVYMEDGDVYINVIDYKSGSQDFDLSEAYYGLKLQLLVYLEALLNEYQRRITGKARPGGIFYFKIDDPLINTRQQAIEVVEHEIRKTLRLRGLVLKDVNIVRKMDAHIDSRSEVLPLAVNKDGTIREGSSVLDEEEFMALLAHVKKLIGRIGCEMLEGNIRIEPVKKGNTTACAYCPYSGICQFDPTLEENGFKRIPKTDRKEIIKRLSEEGRARGWPDGRKNSRKP